MRKRRTPKASDTFLQRICIALDECPSMVAYNIEVPWEDFKVYLSPRHELPDVDGTDEVWWKISEYVSIRLGDMLAIRHELTRALEKDRKKKAIRVNRFRRYHDER